MFNWISPFNYDFAIAAIPIQIVLLIFYGVRVAIMSKGITSRNIFQH